MKVLLGIAFPLLLVIGEGAGTALEPQGAKCGEKRCSTVEYCSPYDTHCKPCSEACDVESHNYQPRECAADCQEYLHDQRYVLRAELNQYEDLKGEVRRLKTLITVSITITGLSLLAIAYLLCKAFLRCDKLTDVFRKTFARSWVKTAPNKVRDDAEVGTVKPNLKLSIPTMPTISATVAPPRTGNSAVSASDSGNGNSNSNGTPNTSSTPLSRRHPSEDTTLDYAYDNPAMTPSPEVAQLRTKRESSF